MRLAAVAMLLAAPGAAAPPSWVGSYVYEQALGPDIAGETQLFVTHRLTLTRDGCRFTAEGFQTYVRLLCDIVPRGDGIEVRFRRYVDPAGPDARAADPYRWAEPLFRLTRVRGGMLTYWESYRNAPDRGPREGRYFRKR